MAVFGATFVPGLAGLLATGQFSRFEGKLERRDFGFFNAVGVDRFNGGLDRGSHKGSGAAMCVKA
jgi:hypothetical protein